jgi:hypothetical protein
VYTNGVGPPGVSGVGAGCPTTSGVVVSTAAVVAGDVVGDVAVRAGVVVEIGEVLVAAGVVPCPRVCLGCTRSEEYWDISKHPQYLC